MLNVPLATKRRARLRASRSQNGNVCSQTNPGLLNLLCLQANDGLLKSTTQIYYVKSTSMPIHFSALYLNLYSKSIQCTTLPTTPLYRSMDFVTHHSLWVYLINHFIFRSLFYQIMDFISHHSLWIDPSLYSNLYSISYWTL